MEKESLRAALASPAFLAFAIVVMTLAVYARVLGHEFINYDDELYVTAQPIVQNGLTLEGIRWAFTNVDAANWHPITWLSHMLDCQLFGLWAGGHHATSVLIHVLNSLILFFLLRRITTETLPSAAIAAAFALHPAHVESVAWIAERKDVLSAFFALLALVSYARFVARPKVTTYLLTLFLFALGLMSKSMIVTLPCVMLLLDFWPLGRTQETRWTRLVIEKIPFFILSFIVGVVAIYAQRASGALVDIEGLSIGQRFGHAAVAYLLYFAKILYFYRLSIYFPVTEFHRSLPIQLLSGTVFVVIAVVYVLTRRKRPWAPVGLFWFAGMLLPVIGLLQVGTQATADRYTYLPSIGGFLLLSGMAWKWEAGPRARPSLWTGFFVGLFLFCFTLSSALYVGEWRDSESIFRHAIDVTGGSSKAHNNLGTALFAQERYGEAEEQFRLALEFGPGNIQALNNLGAALLVLDEPGEALEFFRAVLSVNPGDASVQLNAAVALMDLGRRDDAFAQARHALETDPTYTNAAEFLVHHGAAPAQTPTVAEP